MSGFVQHDDGRFCSVVRIGPSDRPPDDMLPVKLDWDAPHPSRASRWWADAGTAASAAPRGEADRLRAELAEKTAEVDDSTGWPSIGRG